MPELVRTDGSLNQVDERMRILFVTPRYAPLVGGIETHCAEVAQRLTARGHDVTVLTTTPGGNLPAIEQIDGVSVRRVRAWPARGDLYLAPGIFQYVRRHAHELDVIHCQGYHTFVAPTAMLAARRAGVPYVVTFHSGGHSSRLRTMIRGPQQRALRGLFTSASLLIGVSRFEANLFQKRLGLPPEKFAVVRNGSQLPREATVDEHPSSVPLILSVGRLERYKGHHRMIAAMPHVLEEIPSARLRIVGGGPYERELRRQVAALELESAVEIAGIPGTDRHGMARLLSQSALVVLLSDYEAHPVAVMEAVALKRPVLAAYNTGLAELVDEGLARGIPTESSPVDVARAVRECLRSPTPPADVELPTWDSCTSELLRLYQCVARPGRQATNG